MISIINIIIAGIFVRANFRTKDPFNYFVFWGLFSYRSDSDVESVAVEPGADPGILKRGGRVLSF